MTVFSPRVYGDGGNGSDIPDLAIKYWPFFDIAEERKERQGQVVSRYAHCYFMAIDAEWYESGGLNVVLSYQIATLSRTGYCNRIEYVRQGERLTLAEIVELGIRSVNNGCLSENHRGQKTVIILISHNMTAEWSVLQDRDEPYITRRLVAIRKSPVTAIHPISLVLPGNFPIYLRMFDTMLLAPASHRSLKRLSSLLGPEEKKKKDIHERDKKRMDRFLDRDPVMYEEYALRDSQATLEVFLLLQMELNRQAYRDGEGAAFVPRRLFLTLASAAVSGFLDREGSWFRPYLESLQARKFAEATKLVQRSFHGGRNESFFIGDTRNHRETSDKIWLDIDFSGCYPTCMALVPQIDVDGQIEHRTSTYRLDRRRIEKLKKENIPDDVIDKVVDSLRKDQEAGDDDVKKGSYFDLALKVERGGLTHRQARLIRKTAIKYDNTLIDRWYEQWLTAQSDPKSSLSRYIIPGFARVEFEFPEGTRYPCLPVSHTRYGLLYPLRGECTVTAPEILLALQMGASINALASLELPTVKDDDGLPVCYFFDHLSTLIKERSRLDDLAKSGDQVAEVGEKLLKEFINGFYGKTAQAINPRKTYRPASGEMYPLRRSPISEPSVAAMITGLARAALSALLVAIDRFNEGRAGEDQVTIISATTDGVLIGVKAPLGYSVVEDYYKVPPGTEAETQEPGRERNLEKSPKLVKGLALEAVLENDRFNTGGLWERLGEYLPLRQMQRARIALTGKAKAPYLEIKHMADWVLSVKTRGQIGMLDTGMASLIAKFGLKPPLSEIIPDEDEYRLVFEDDGMHRPTREAHWIMEQVRKTQEAGAEIHTYNFYGLRSFSEIIKSEDRVDLTQKISDRRFNADYDWKRCLVRRIPDEGGGISPFTVPHADVSAMLRYRNQMEAIRKAGYVAQPEKVLHRVAVKGRKARFRHGDAATLVRLFLRGCLHNHIPSSMPTVKGAERKRPGRKRKSSEDVSYPLLAGRLTELWQEMGLHHGSRKESWTDVDFQNAVRTRDWEPGVLMRTEPLCQLLARLADAFGADFQHAERQLFAGEEHVSLHRELVAHVTAALHHAAREGIPPFPELQEQGRLPDRDSLLRVFAPHLTERGLALCETVRFRAQERPPQDRPRLVKIFRIAGMSVAEANLCARALIQPKERGRKPKNPAEAKCLEQFLIAIQQPDIVPRSLSRSYIVGSLSKYELSYSWYQRLQGVKFVPRTLTNTSANRDQIMRMANKMKLDPLPLIDVLIDK